MAKKKSSTKQESTAQRWTSQTEKVYETTLKSGNKVRYRRINLLHLAKAGTVPKNLIPAAVKSLTEPILMSGDQWLQAFEVNQRIVCAALVEPRVVMTTEELEKLAEEDVEAVLVDVVPPDDLAEIANLLLSPVEAAADPTAS